MDSDRFDVLSRRFAQRATRRSVVRGIAGSGAALAAMSVASSVLGAPAGKVDVCHYDADSGSFHPISVSGNAVDAHLAHGDYLQEVHLTLSATNPAPVDTGVFLAAGTSATVSITGVAGWCCNLQLDASGMSASGNHGACGDWGIPFDCGSVVGVIGGGDIFSDYTPFFPVGVGPTTVTASGSSGELWLQYVDGCPECYGDNNGALQVTITRSC